MATRGIAIQAPKVGTLMKLGRELWILFLFYLKIFLAAILCAGVGFYLYAAFKSGKGIFSIALAMSIILVIASLLLLMALNLRGSHPHANSNPPALLVLWLTLLPALFVLTISSSLVWIVVLTGWNLIAAAFGVLFYMFRKA